MSKRQLIDDIRALNPTAQPQFLSQFSESELQEYLDHLQSAIKKRHLRLDEEAQTEERLRKVS